MEKWVKEIRYGKPVMVRKEEVRPFVDQVEWNLRLAQFGQGAPHCIHFHVYRRVTSSDGIGEMLEERKSITCEPCTPGDLREFARQCENLIAKHKAVKGRW
jgi:hypothetical protein